MAKWAYDAPSHLVLETSGGSTLLKSAQGVRQGDPLGPLFFSIGVRPILEDLCNSLGPDCVLLAYLDDVYILSKSEGTLEHVSNFFDRPNNSLKLNEEKSYTTSVMEIKMRGLKILGSHIGPSWSRQEFLLGKVAKLEEKLQRLVDLPNQHALLLLRLCMQQDLRHLQRCLDPDGLSDEWERVDQAIWKAAIRIRGSTDQPDPSDLDERLLSLPVRLGGLGLLSHQTCAPLAFAASSETSDQLLIPMLGAPAFEPMLTDADDPESIKSQKDRCDEALLAQRDALLATLDDHEMKTILESASGLGRKWLEVIPYYGSLRLSDFEVSGALHLRTLHPGSEVICPQCGNRNCVGHAETCTGRARWVVARHEQVKRAIAASLSKIEGVQVSVEPFIAQTNRRNDIRVTGSSASGLANHEYDVTIVSLATRDGRDAFIPAHQLPTNIAEKGHALIDKFLSKKAADKVNRLPANSIPFSPLVFTVGGMMDAKTADVIKTWKDSMSIPAHKDLTYQLSLILLRARAKTFVL